MYDIPAKDYDIRTLDRIEAERKRSQAKLALMQQVEERALALEREDIRKREIEQARLGQSLMHSWSNYRNQQDASRIEREYITQKIQGAERQAQWDADAEVVKRTNALWNELKTPAVYDTLKDEAKAALLKEGLDVTTMSPQQSEWLLWQRVMEDRMAKEAKAGRTVEAEALRQYIDQGKAQFEQSAQVQDLAKQGAVTPQQVQQAGYKVNAPQEKEPTAFQQSVLGQRGQQAYQNLTRNQQVAQGDTFWQKLVDTAKQDRLQRSNWMMLAGIGNTFDALGGAVSALGQDGSTFRNAGMKLQDYATAKTGAGGEGAEITDTIYQSVPFLVAALGMAYGGIAAAGVLGLGTVGTMVVGSLIGAGASRPFESLIEAGGTYNEIIKRGGSQEEARKGFNSVFQGNMTLAGWDALQIAAAFWPAGRVAGKAASKIIKTLRIGGKMTVVGLSEGGEEVYQEILQAKATGDPWYSEPWKWTDEQRLAFQVGSAMGVGFGGAGDVLTMGPKVRAIAPETFDVAHDSAIAEGKPEDVAVAEAIIEVAKEQPQAVEQAISVAELNQQATAVTQERAPSVDKQTEWTETLPSGRVVHHGGIVLDTSTGETSVGAARRIRNADIAAQKRSTEQTNWMRDMAARGQRAPSVEIQGTEGNVGEAANRLQSLKNELARTTDEADRLALATEIARLSAKLQSLSQEGTTVPETGVAESATTETEQASTERIVRGTRLRDTKTGVTLTVTDIARPPDSEYIASLEAKAKNGAIVKVEHDDIGTRYVVAQANQTYAQSQAPTTQEAGKEIFSRDEIEVSKPETQRRKGPNGTNTRVTVRVQAPFKKTHDNWNALDTSRIEVQVTATGDYATSTAPKKADAKWIVQTKDATYGTVTVLARDKTFNDAVEWAKDYVYGANPAQQAPDTSGQIIGESSTPMSFDEQYKNLGAAGMRLPELLLSDDYRADAIKYIKRELTRLNKEGVKKIDMPKANKLLAAIEKANGPIKRGKAIAKAQETIDLVEKGGLIDRINSKLKQAKVKKVAGTPKPRLDVPSQRTIDDIATAVRTGTSERRAAAQSARDNAYRQHANGEITEVQLGDVLDSTELDIVYLPEMSAVELIVLDNTIDQVRRGGRSARSEIIKANEERRQAERVQGIGAITSGKGLEGQSYSVPKEGQVPWWKSPGRFWLSQFAWTDLMNMLDRKGGGTGEFGSKRFAGFHSRKWGDGAQRAHNKRAEVAHRYEDKLDEMVFRVFNTDKRGVVDRILADYHQVDRKGNVKNRVYLGTFPNANGVMVPLRLSIGEMGTLHNIMKNPDSFATIENPDGMAWTTAMEEAVENKLTDQQKAFFDGLQGILKEMAAEIKPVYESDFHVPFNEVVAYWPWIRDGRTIREATAAWATDAPGSTSGMLVVLDTIAQSASPRNGSLKTRTKSRLPFKFLDASRTYSVHVTRMAHYVAYAEFVKEARHYFNNNEVKAAIEQEFGDGMNAAIKETLDNIARGSFDPAKVIPWMDALRQKFTYSVFAGSVPIFLKQLPSLIGYSTEIGPVALVEGMADFIRHPVASYKEMMANSPTTVARFGRGFDLDIKNAWERHRGPMRAGRLSDVATIQIRFGDRIAVAAGQWAVYKAQLAQGMSVEEAWRATERITERTQPSASMHSIAGVRQQGSAMRAMTMFTDQLNKYFRMEANAFGDLFTGRDSASRALYTLAITHVVIPSLIQWISNAFRWEPEEQARAAFVGPLNGFLIVGSFINSLIDKMEGKRWDYEPSPILSSASSLGYAAEKWPKLKKKIDDPAQDVEWSDVWPILEEVLMAVGYATGTPMPFAKKVKGAIEDEDIRRLVYSEYQLTGGEPEATPKPTRPMLDVSRIG